MSNDSNWPAQPPATPPQAQQDAVVGEPVVDGLEAQDYVQHREVISSGRVGRIVALVVGLAFLGGVGALVVAGFSGDREGAESPDAAVEQLSLALSNEDVVAALEVMAPSEVGSASALYPRVIDLAVREGELENADWLAGVDFNVTGLETRTTTLHPDVALVELVSGTISVSIDPEIADDFWLEDGVLEDSITIARMRRELRDGLDDAAEFNDGSFGLPFTIAQPEGIFLMTVKRNGGWFVSPLYTAAEYGRQILDLPAADFSLSREQAMAGASSPSGVVDDVVSMINDHSLEEHLDIALAGDPDGIYEAFNVLVPPDEAGVFLDYSASYATLAEDFMGAAAFGTEDFQQEIEAMVDEINLSGDITIEVEVSEQERDDGAVVLGFASGSIAIEASATDPSFGEPTTVDVEASWDGLCGRATAIIDGFAERPVSDCVPSDVLPDGFDEVFVVVGEVNGDWYVSYVETALAYAEIFLEDALAE